MSGELLAVTPFAILAVGAATIVLADRVLRPDPRAWSLFGAALGVAAAVAALIAGTGADAFAGVLRRDGAAMFTTTLVGAGTAATLLLAAGRTAERAPLAAELTGLVLLSAAGATLAAASADLAVLFVAFELLIAPLYASSGLTEAGHGDRRAAVERLLGGVAASALFAFGVAALYADTGSLAVGALATMTSTLGRLGAALVLVALAARAGLIPLHLWVRPAYAAATLPIAAFVAAIVPVASLTALLRIGGAITASPGAVADWSASIAVLAAITVVAANLAALRAASLADLVGWAAIAQVGYVAIAAAAGAAASGAVAFALVTSSMLAVASFAVLALLGAPARLTDLRGLARARTGAAVALGIVLLGLAGLPPTAGFVARLYVFEAAVRAQLAWLVVVGALAMVLGAAAGLRVLGACLEEGERTPPRRAIVTSCVVAAAAIATVLVGVLPGPVLDALAAVRF